jgi:hypothetical protein
MLISGTEVIKPGELSPLPAERGLRILIPMDLCFGLELLGFTEHKGSGHDNDEVN